MRDYELRLVGHDSDDGEILFEDLDRIGTAIKAAIYRLTRDAADRSGTGRAPADIERLASVRVGLAAGSTRLMFRIGDRSALSVDPLADDVDDAFWSIIEGLRDNRRPQALGESVIAAVSDLAVALRKAAPRVEFSVPRHGSASIVSETIDASIWSPSTPDGGSEAAVHGFLEMVDLKNAAFRVVDAVGNAVDLKSVRQPAEASALIGRQVTAIGPLHRGSGAKHDRMDSPTVTAATPLSERFNLAPQAGLDELIAASKLSPEPSGIDLSDDELDDFLAVIRG